MKDMLDRVNYEKPVVDSFSYVDDFTRVAADERAGQLKKKSEARSWQRWALRLTRRERTTWTPFMLTDKENIIVRATLATERNSTMMDEQDDTRARDRLAEAGEFAGHVETVTTLSRGIMTRSVLMKSKSIARDLDFDAKVVHPPWEDETPSWNSLSRKRETSVRS